MDGFGQAFEAARAEVFVLEDISREPLGPVRHDDRVGRREALHERSQVGCLSHGGSEAIGVVGPRRLDHNGPGGDTDSDRQPFGRIENADRFNDIEGGAYRSLRVVLMRFGIAEVRHHAITEILGDVAVVALDSRRASTAIYAHHVAEIFWIQTFGQRGRADEIAEHHGELAPLGGDSGRWLCVRRGGGAFQRRAATAAEVFTRAIAESARRTRLCERSTACRTEATFGPVLTVAAWAAHPPPPKTFGGPPVF